MLSRPLIALLLVPAAGCGEEKESAGTIDYVCTIHPSQRGSITVVAN